MESSETFGYDVQVVKAGSVVAGRAERFHFGVVIDGTGFENHGHGAFA